MNLLMELLVLLDMILLLRLATGGAASSVSYWDVGVANNEPYPL